MPGTITVSRRLLNALIAKATGRGGRGRMGGFALGPGSKCVCPECGQEIDHETGKPCYEIECPKCGAAMTRKEVSSK